MHSQLALDAIIKSNQFLQETLRKADGHKQLQKLFNTSFQAENPFLLKLEKTGLFRPHVPIEENLETLVLTITEVERAMRGKIKTTSCEFHSLQSFASNLDLLLSLASREKEKKLQVATERQHLMPQELVASIKKLHNAQLQLQQVANTLKAFKQA